MDLAQAAGSSCGVIGEFECFGGWLGHVWIGSVPSSRWELSFFGILELLPSLVSLHSAERLASLKRFLFYLDDREFIVLLNKVPLLHIEIPQVFPSSLRDLILLANLHQLQLQLGYLFTTRFLLLG